MFSLSSVADLPFTPLIYSGLRTGTGSRIDRLSSVNLAINASDCSMLKRVRICLGEYR